MTITPIQSGNSILRPRARLIKTIGEDLISSDKVALLELVKNSYDADATIIVIEFAGRVVVEREGKKEKKKLVKEGSSIQIYDDGTGMSLKTILDAWMEPATISKKLSIESKVKNRRFTGEKGIGRFSSARLSSELEIITRVENDNEVVALFSWDAFDNIDLYLDQVNCSWEVRDPIEFVGTRHGTKLILNKLNSDWDEEKLRDLRITLQRLINPVAPVTDFLIELKLPKQFELYSGIIDSPQSLTTPNYSFKGSVDNLGIVIGEFASKKHGSSSVESFSLTKMEEKFRTGPFTFDFKVWDRDESSLKEIARETSAKVKEVRDSLNELSGISIYRNGFRVLPYGEPNLDWLRLDLRRVNNPTMRISNNQVIGYISIDLEANPAFTDQSNREGIVDSEEFDQLKEYIKSILAALEVKRYEERPRENTTSSSTEGIFDSLTIAPILQLVESKLPGDKEALDLVTKTEETLHKSVSRIQDVLSRYRRLSTLGFLIDLVLHDGNNFLGLIDAHIHMLIRSIKSNGYDNHTFAEHMGHIEESRTALATLFKRIEPFGGRKRGKPVEMVLEEAIANVFGLFQADLDKLNVKVVLPDSHTQTIFSASDLQIIIFNLLQNSLFWLEDSLEDLRQIVVMIDASDDQFSIIFSDNGPGIKEEHQQLIYDPYFTTRPEGIGLGLTIVGEVVTENEGNLSLIDNGPLEGATFLITFKREAEK